MVEITAKINGMACGMCETHINDAVRNNFKVKKVTSSHSKAQTVIVAEEDIPDDKLKEVVEKAGYEFAGADIKNRYAVCWLHTDLLFYYFFSSV